MGGVVDGEVCDAESLELLLVVITVVAGTKDIIAIGIEI
jgi:hypothetical protein